MALPEVNGLIELIKDRLFVPEFRRLANGIEQLVKHHEELTKDFKKGFMYSGEIYRASGHPTYPSYSMLAWDLNDEMEKWLKDRKQLVLDQAQIGQMLFKLMYQANDLQELRDTLPECLVPLVPAFEGMERKFDQGFIIRHSPRDVKQLAKILPKIEMYAMARLIY